MLRKNSGGRGSSRSPTRPSTERSSSRNAGRLSPRYQPVKSHLHPHGYTEDDGPPAPGPGGYVPPNASLRATGLVVTHNGLETETSVSKPSRISVMKTKKENAPMRFKISLPANYNAHDNQHYMQLSDSDDDDKPDRTVGSIHGGTRSSIGTAGGNTGKSTGAGGKKKAAGGAGAKPGEALFKHEKPVIRERPVSAKQFRIVATADPEFKVHYRHTNFRRMPLTEAQEIWLEEKETARGKLSVETAHKLAEAVQAKADKKKDKGGDKPKKDDKKKDAKKKDATAAPVDEKPKPKYKSAAQFMNVMFPNFEGDDVPESIGPMRAMQLVEVARVMGACDEYDVKIKESALRKALIIPQDKPEAICLENLRTETEGLMGNPLPPEYWRKMAVAKGKKGKKKKKSKG